jgi:lysozyme family protein
MMTERFERAFALLKVHEGGYVNHPRDPGGATNKGVTQRTYDAYRARINQPRQDVRSISHFEVRTIYKQQYWDAVQADHLPHGVAYCVFDAAANSGPGQAARWLQRSVGAGVDGVVGNETIAAARRADRSHTINAYCDMRLAFMKRLKHWGAFKNGWTRRVSEVRAQSLAWAAAKDVHASTETVQPKAIGPEGQIATLVDMARNPGALGAVGGVLGGAGALTSGDGPVQYAIAAVLVLAALVGVWWLVRGRGR